MADPANPVPTEATSVSFSFLSSDEVRRISVKQITNPLLFDALSNPTLGGLYDPALGPTRRADICSTCRLSSYDCPGHYGHIDLPTPVFHPLFLTQTYNLLRGSCFVCHRFLMPAPLVAQYKARFTLLERGLVAESDELEQVNIQASKPLNKRKADSLEERGEDTGESLVEYEQRLWKHLTTALKKAKQESGRRDRDDYKDAVCFDRRKALVQDFLKSTIRKKCSNCRAHHHRMRKEGHTKLMETSLTLKQQQQDAQAGVERRNILIQQAAAAKARKQQKAGKANGKSTSKLRHELDKEDSQGYNVEEFDSDADSQEPEAPNGREATPASSADDSEEDSSPEEAQEDNEVDLGDSDEGETDQISLANAQNSNKPSASGRSKQVERMIPPDECRRHLRALFENEPEICALLFASHGPLPTLLGKFYDRVASSIDDGHKHSRRSQFGQASADMFFLDVLAVPPSRFRPAATMGDQSFESAQNELMGAVLRATLNIRDRLALYRQATAKKPNGVDAGSGLTATPVLAGPQDRVRLYGLLLEAIIGLQVAVNSLVDSTKNPAPMRQGKEPPAGIKQVLEKKEGLFRKNMMGKRVNYAARSVISPDINIETNEIGVPPVFARKLTFPEPVTPHNVKRMMQLVINGPKVHPGAMFIQNEDGYMISLERMTDEQRHAQAQQLLTPSAHARTHAHGRPDVGLPQTKTAQLNRKVYRHLDDGDVLILNRQPTLHKPSMMCHRARILRGEKTIRMHYANCNSYNADFDGDEMNMHFPQSYIAQAEARMIANTDNQYLVPTSGNPLRGLIQDHVVAGTWMTNKDTFFTRDEYFQLIYGALRPEDNYSGQGRVITLPPALWRPQKLWTGKQIIATILKNVVPADAKGLYMSSGSKVPADAWGAHNSEEGKVLFYDGEMITGTLDKSQFGATSYGLVHTCYELYGGETAGKLLGILSRLFTKYLQHRAFSCRMDDLILTPEGNKVRADHIKSASQRGYSAALKVVQLDKEKNTDSAETKHNLNVRLESILRDDAKLAGLDAVVTAVMGELTSQTIKDCLPLGLVKPFPHNNMQTMTISGAKGSNVNASQISCMLGQQSLEGRRVPTMVSGKTLPSFKAFETAPRAGGYVAQRFLTGIRPQEYYFHCMAGREGLIDTAVKTSRSGYLQRCLIKHLEGIKVNYDHTVRNADQSIIQFLYGEDGLDVTKQKSLTQFEWVTRNMGTMAGRFHIDQSAEKLDVDTATEYMKAVLKINKKASPADVRSGDVPDPAIAVYSPSTFVGSVSESYADALGSYVKGNPQKLIKSKKKDRKTWPEWHLKQHDSLLDPNTYEALMNLRYMRCLADPGEAVGLLASQGVGEPSTQMTLNTFHFAGHGAANVTLGIPRLREIVMTASATIKTPTMRMKVRKDVDQEEVEVFCKEASKVTLSQVIADLNVEEKLSTKNSDNAFSRDKLYTIRFNFFPRAEYEEEFRVSPEQILRSILRGFTPLFDKEVIKASRNATKGVRLSEIGKGQRVRDSKQRTETGDDVEAGDGQGAVEDEMEVRRNDAAEELDNDADDARRMQQGHDEPDYDDSDEDDDASDTAELPMDVEALDRAFAKDADMDDAQTNGNASDADSDDIDDESDAVSARRLAKVEEADRVERLEQLEETIGNRARFFTAARFDKSPAAAFCELDLKFGAKQPKLLLIGIIEACCRGAVVHQAPGITRCFIATREKSAKPDDPDHCVTEGVNLAGAWDFADGIVDMDTIYSNDIAAMLRTYGVEAARTVLIKEIQAVFGVYGIGVDRRHLTLIADYMTSEGGYKPFNRMGLSNSPSPFLKASFETTASFLSDATLFGDFEDLTSPSASIVMGKIAHTGTGIFDLAISISAH